MGKSIIQNVLNLLSNFLLQIHTSLIILKNDLNWDKSILYLTKNKTVDREKVSKLSLDVRLKIEELNKYDMELFEYSKKINEELLTKYDIMHELNSFNKKNELYQKLISPIHNVINYSKQMYHQNTLGRKKEIHNK